MVRNTYPHYLEDASRQRANMKLDLESALTRLEEVCHEKFQVRVEELIFPEKIWLINETNLLSRYMTWGQEDGVTMINLDEFESELLSNENTARLFKTGKLVSFIRQFNLYDFKKKSDVFVDVEDNGNQLRYGLYYHSFVRPNRQDLLRQCVRKVVKRASLHGHGGHVKRSDADSDSEGTYTPTPKKKLRGRPDSPRIKVDVGDSCDTLPEPVESAAQLGGLCSMMPQELSLGLGAPSMASTTPVKSARVRPTSMRLRSCSNTTPKEPAIVMTKQQKDANRVFWVKRWLEMPAEWRNFPEVGEKEYSSGWMADYAWNLDPMAVGELAALANCGQPENIHAALSDDELTQWIQELDVMELPDFSSHELMSL